MEQSKFNQLKAKGFPGISQWIFWQKQIFDLNKEQKKELCEFLAYRLATDPNKDIGEQTHFMAMVCTILTDAIEVEISSGRTTTSNKLKRLIAQSISTCFEFGQDLNIKDGEPKTKMDLQIESIQNHMDILSETEKVVDRLMKFLSDATEDDKKYLNEIVVNYAISTAKKSLLLFTSAMEGGEND